MESGAVPVVGLLPDRIRARVHELHLGRRGEGRQVGELGDLAVLQVDAVQVGNLFRSELTNNLLPPAYQPGLVK